MDELSKLSNEHAQRGYGSSRIGFGRKFAVVVVDFQKLLTDPESPMGGNPLISQAVLSTASLLEAARLKQIQIIYTVVAYRADGKDLGLWPYKVKNLPICITGSRWAEVANEIRPESGDIIIYKRMASAFFGTNLLSILIANGVDTVLLAGGTTGGCVRATAVDAFQYGFRTVIPMECVADQNDVSNLANLRDIDLRYGDVLALQEVLNRIQS